MFTFTPLLGAQSASSALQSLLEFDGGIKLLVDVGWDESFDADQLHELEKQTPTISVILLTHATLAHIGAYAHCCKHVPLFRRIPVYATTPVISLGRTLVQDLYASNPLASSIIPQSALNDSGISYLSATATDRPSILLPPPTPEEIADYFSAISPLKYSQPHQPSSSPFAPSLVGLSVTAYRAGHTLGGTIWHIQYGSESVVYAVDWNQARENVLAGAAWLGSTGGNEVIEQLRKPTALVCSCKNSESDAFVGGWTKRDDALLQQIRKTIANGASVLIPSDSSARSLELLYLLERAWLDDDRDELRRAKLFFASRSGGSTIRYARSMGEWMDEGLKSEFDTVNERAEQRRVANGKPSSGRKKVELPFEFQFLRVIERPASLERALAADGPKVFIASDTSMDWGFSRTIAQNLFAQKDNLIVLSSRSSSIAGTQTLSRNLFGLATSNNLQLDQNSSLLTGKLQVKAHQIQPLGQTELNTYQNYLAKQKQRESALPANQSSTLETSADAVDDDASSSSSSSDEEDDAQYQGKALNVSAAMTHSKNKLGLTDEELGVNVLLRRRNVHDYDVRGKKGREKLFPYSAKRRRNDEFGDIIRPEDYLRAEEREDIDAQNTGQEQGKEATDMGTKRKWDDHADASTTDPRRRGQDSASRRPRPKNNAATTAANGGDDEEEATEESDYEPDEAVVYAPQQVDFTTEDLELSVHVAFIDYSALHDKRALQLLLPLIKPRKLLLTGGTVSETEFLASECRRIFAQVSSSEGGFDVFLPQNGAVIDASVDTNAWTIKLSQALYRKLNWQMIDASHGIVTINGQVEAAKLDDSSSEVQEAKRVKISAADDGVSNQTEKTSLPILDVLPMNLAATTRAAQKLHVGDMRLPELRRLLQAQGHKAEFRGAGTLLVDGFIVVRKSGLGRIEVESAPPPVMAGVLADRTRASFHNVKREIYKSLAVVSAR